MAPKVTRHFRQHGFTMVEVLMSLVVFITAVVGVVAMQSKAIEAQRAALELREGERIAHATMADILNTGFNELIERNFSGDAAPTMPYSDAELNTVEIVDYRGVPADGDDVFKPGSREDYYWVGRTVTQIPSTVNPGGNSALVDGVQIDVLVMWLDTTNPTLPPLENIGVSALEPDMVDANSEDFRPWVSHVRLRTVRVNDGAQ